MPAMPAQVALAEAFHPLSRPKSSTFGADRLCGRRGTSPSASEKHTTDVESCIMITTLFGGGHKG